MGFYQSCAGGNGYLMGSAERAGAPLIVNARSKTMAPSNVRGEVEKIGVGGRSPFFNKMMFQGRQPRLPSPKTSLVLFVMSPKSWRCNFRPSFGIKLGPFIGSRHMPPTLLRFLQRFLATPWCEVAGDSFSRFFEHFGIHFGAQLESLWPQIEIS